MANPSGKKGLADREKNVLLILASIVILALAWFMGYQKLNDKRAVVDEQNVQLQAEVDELDSKVSQEASTRRDTEEKRDLINKMLLQYPGEIRTQDVINRYDQLEKKVKGLTVETEAFTMNQIFFMGGAVLDQLVQSTDIQTDANAAGTANTTDTTNTTNDAGTADTSGQSTEGAPASAAYIGYRSDSVATFTTKYEDLKTILNFVNQYQDGRMNVRTLNIAAEEGSKPLQCSMTVSMYTIGGRTDEQGNTEYTSPQFGGVSYKKEDIFNK